MKNKSYDHADCTPVPKRFVQGKDYYINEQGNWVFTAEYHLKRGYCCNNGCKHCPYPKP